MGTRTRSRHSRVVITGQGYVGLPLAVRAAEVGHEVIGFDVDEQRVKRLVLGESYVEDVPSAQLRPLVESGRYRATLDPQDCAGFDIAVITVPTPLRDGLRDGTPDLSNVRASAEMIAGLLRPGATVILESTTYPGTTEELVASILQARSGLTAGRDFHLGYSPERIDPCNPRWHLENTPKIVSGIDPTSLAAVRSFYATVVSTVVPVASCRIAELTKLLENTFRHVNIALVNELAVFSHELGIDIWEAIDAAATKPHGYMRFVPGPGVGGHCLPIDPSYLSWRVERTLGRSFRFIELANDINSHMPDYVVRRLAAALNRNRRSVYGSRVLLLGLSYKANIGDARQTPSLRVAELLTHMGAEVRAADPHVAEGIHTADGVLTELCRVEATPEELAAADAVVLLTDHDRFDYTLVAAHAPFVLDCRRRVSGPTIEAL